MKKVAIITITNGKLNFGNRLQNYALQTALEKYSVCPRTIYSVNAVGNSLFLSKNKRFLKRIKSILLAPSRQRAFESFDRRYIKKAKRIRYGDLNDHEFREEYDAFIAGSDQVWNPAFWFTSSFEFMAFAEPSKRYSYAASFGVSEISEEHREVFAKRLGQIKEISVREDQAGKIVRKLTNRQPKVHVDPTLLLSAGQYSELEENPGNLPGKYLLTYFLGELSDEYRAFLKKVAKIQGLSIVDIGKSPDCPFYHIGPQHFLYLIHHAEYICTDSFHGCVFSIIFRRQFTVFFRLGASIQMNSRIDTLLDKIRLTDRFYGRLPLEGCLHPIPYEAIEPYLKEEQNAAEKYLRDIISQW